ncbi:PREDICTED: uncharacterized protein LOC108366459 [Rhagoletis zephyria]|uniref:uncharacterized protein LOC108366459 n=1 Tax=Rhagoletis zephyria TaxID=28612 RepID=UPI0008113B84|nr:PREDICTED: uncharacterized protein LOC108366459 [Rhagoletis zephyria]
MSHFFTTAVFIALLSGCSFAYSCRLNIGGPSPLFTKDFGSKTIVFRTHGSELVFENGETIQVYCNNGLRIERNYYADIFPTDRRAEFTCESMSIMYEGNATPFVKVSCSLEAALSFYESNRKLPKCKSFMSYALGVKLPAIGDFIKAAICYDLERLTLKYVTYIADHKKISIFNKLNANSELIVDLGQKVNNPNNYFNFINQNSLETSQNLEKFPFNSHEFHFESLLQGQPLNEELKDYADLFNTMWWRQLRQENWRYFLDALRERTLSAKYQVFMGTYGNITIPSTQPNCSSTKSEVVSVHNEDMVVQAPGYIWAYLKSLIPGESEEFVVIGHNSPYARNPSHTEFCTVDICDNIAWLRESNFGNLRRLPSLGYTFWCRPGEVAKVIDYFPLYDDNVESTTISRILQPFNMDVNERDFDLLFS